MPDTSKRINQKIIDLAKPFAEGLTATDLRIGLVYTSVRLSNGNTGVAWTGHRSPGGCIHRHDAGEIAGKPAKNLLNLLADKTDPLNRSIGLAAANALSAGMPPEANLSDEILGLIGISKTDHVAMVGFFGPLIPRIKKTGCRLDILELQEHMPGTISANAGKEALADCSVAIITATAIVTDTMDDLISALGNPRAAVILGPSTFMRTEVYRNTPITHIAGVNIQNASAVERIVSEGGGTKSLKKHMDFVTIYQ